MPMWKVPRFPSSAHRASHVLSSTPCPIFRSVRWGRCWHWCDDPDTSSSLPSWHSHHPPKFLGQEGTTHLLCNLGLREVAVLEDMCQRTVTQAPQAQGHWARRASMLTPTWKQGRKYAAQRSALAGWTAFHSLHGWDCLTLKSG